MAFCGSCYPDKFAKKYTAINNVIVPGFDKIKQDLAKRQAWADDRVYKIQFPRDYKKIEDVLRVRKEEHRSWEVGETVDLLEAENEHNPVLSYIKKKDEKEEKAEAKEGKNPPADLDEKTLRRIK